MSEAKSGANLPVHAPAYRFAHTGYALRRLLCIAVAPTTAGLPRVITFRVARINRLQTAFLFTVPKIFEQMSV